jgi:hypothetical protein
MKQRIDEHLGSRVSALDILGELQSVVADRMSLTSLTVEALEVRVPVERPADASRGVVGRSAAQETKSTRRVRLTITGVAPTDMDVANFIGQLASSPLFENIDMDYSRVVEYEGRMVREFQTTCFVVK